MEVATAGSVLDRMAGNEVMGMNIEVLVTTGTQRGGLVDLRNFIVDGSSWARLLDFMGTTGEKVGPCRGGFAPLQDRSDGHVDRTQV